MSLLSLIGWGLICATAFFRWRREEAIRAIRGLEKQVAAQAERIEELARRLDASEKDRESLHAENVKLRLRCSRQRRQIKRMTLEHAATVEGLQKELDTLKARLDQLLNAPAAPPRIQT